jgi:DNA-binding GntR family transcriptional regulator
VSFVPQGRPESRVLYKVSPAVDGVALRLPVRIGCDGQIQMSADSIVKSDDDNRGAVRSRRLVQSIERDINTGRLSAGAWLKQVDLEEQYKASRFDIRQALDRLEEKGLVKLIANRGYRVEEFDRAQIRNLVAIRAILEVAAAEDVMANIDAKGLGELQALAQGFADAVAHDTVIAQEEANLAFHRLMLAYCRNADLVALIFEMRSRIPVALVRERNTAASMACKSQDHFDIVRHLREREGPALAALMRRHVNSTFESF